MLQAFTIMLRIFGIACKAKQTLIAENLLLQKENEILRRKLQRRKIRTKQTDRIYLTFINLFSSITDKVRIVKPETLLKWKNQWIRGHWTYPTSKEQVGRPPVPKHHRELILRMKNENIFFGAKRIQGELEKQGILLHKDTVRRILAWFRKRGKIKNSLTWAKFLKMQIKSIYAMDFFTVDTVTGIRYYVYFIIKHETRQIVQFAITQNPAHNFVRQQIVLFSEQVAEKTHQLLRMIHDNGGEFFDLAPYGIQSVRTSVRAPNMNAIAERLVRTIRQECLDWFFILNEKQLKKVLTEFILYYNTRRPHQSLAQDSPLGYEPQTRGRIICRPVLSGLFHDYHRIENALT